MTGYWFLEDADVSAKKWTPPPDLVAFIDNAHKLEKKVVYIGFGSIVVSDPRAMTRCVIEAVVQSGVHAILSKGWSDRLHVKTADASDSEEPLPKQIYSISSIPHDWLFRRIDAACHHGGAGTTGASLRCEFSVDDGLKSTQRSGSWDTDNHQTVLWRSVFLGRQSRSVGSGIRCSETHHRLFNGRSHPCNHRSQANRAGKAYWRTDPRSTSRDTFGCSILILI